MASASAKPRQSSEVIQPSDQDNAALQRLFEALSASPEASTHCLSSPDEAALPLTPELYEVLRRAVQYLLAGSAVAISPLERRLSTTEAGDLLGVSRQYLTRLIDKGEIECDRTGRHRRLKLSDVLAYKQKRDDERQKLLDELTGDAVELGAYD